MPDPKLFSGFSIPVTTRIEESQFKELREIVAKTVNILAKDGKALKFSLTNIDSSNVTELNTNITNISSEDGETVINGPLLEMYDDTSTLRLKMGFDEDTSTFIFSLKDDSGSETIGVDSNGDAIFKGTVTVGTDYPVEITNNSGSGIIRFYDDTTLHGWLAYLTGIDALTLFALENSDISIWASSGAVNIISSDEINLNPTGDLQIGGSAGWTGTFTNGDGDTVTVKKGIITGVA